MSIRRLQGWALVVSGVLGLLAILKSDSSAARALLVVGAVLLIVGVPAIEGVQRLGALGVLGIALIELAAIVALILNLTGSGGGAIGGALPLASALAGAVGRVIVGWLTSRQRLFPAWAGWAFIAEGVLNFLAGVIEAPALGPIVLVLLPLLGAAALVGYGLGILRHAAGQLHQPTPASR